jgi:hypothetical protein
MNKQAETQREKCRTRETTEKATQILRARDDDGDQQRTAKERREIHKRDDREEKGEKEKGQQSGTSTTILSLLPLISASDLHPVHRIHEPILPDLRIRHSALRVEPCLDFLDQLVVKPFVSALLIAIFLLEFQGSLLVAMLALGAARTLVLRIALGSDGVIVVALALSPSFLVLFIGIVPGAHVAAAAL